MNDTPGDTGWSYARRCLSQLKPGDEVILYLRDWRIGPVRTIIRTGIADNRWHPTIQAGVRPQNSIEID